MPQKATYTAYGRTFPGRCPDVASCFGGWRASCSSTCSSSGTRTSSTSSSRDTLYFVGPRMDTACALRAQVPSGGCRPVQQPPAVPMTNGTHSLLVCRPQFPPGKAHGKDYEQHEEQTRKGSRRVVLAHAGDAAEHSANEHHGLQRQHRPRGDYVHGERSTSVAAARPEVGKRHLPATAGAPFAQKHRRACWYCDKQQ